MRNSGNTELLRLSVLSPARISGNKVSCKTSTGIAASTAPAARARAERIRWESSWRPTWETATKSDHLMPKMRRAYKLK